MRNFIDIIENKLETFIVYHGSPYDDIKEFRTQGLRNRTGTSGTLSFTTNIETAKVYGKYIYTVEVRGNFGDYQNEDDVAAVIQWRINEAKNNGYFQKVMKTPGMWESLFEKIKKEVSEGYYAKWENKSLWRDLGWDGAWCFESDGKNLIIGDAKNIVRIIDVKNYQNELLERIEKMPHLTDNYRKATADYPDVSLYWNPTPQQTINLLNKAKGDYLKMYVIGNDVVVWDGYWAEHVDVERYLNIQPVAKRAGRLFASYDISSDNEQYVRIGGYDDPKYVHIPCIKKMIEDGFVWQDFL